MKYAGWNDFKEELWGFIFGALQQKATNIMNEEQAREVFESKGEFLLRQMDCHELKKEYVEDLDYDKGVLCWHIATEICYNNDEDKSDGHGEWSKTLSNYLMYLLIYRPKLMATVIGISLERYAATCLEVKELAKKLGAVNLKDFCEKVLEDRGKDEGAGDPEMGRGGKDLKHQEEPKAAENGGHDKLEIESDQTLKTN